ncbi:hypothetical protein [Rhabdothermincola salaria]|uniref:hypothetical protein n=1 Tax=Rhabdothermincola salaria TaxID=2903142 RepID=UPI001E58C338|nr:hypothetical protein [Rhabdothermincola salaria]MCD9624233.1 hypothetical protein [Rhabdothermincola salaria]
MGAWDSGQDPAAAAEGVVREIALREQAIAIRRRRLLLALYDLGVLDLVGRDWVQVVDDGVVFATLSDTQVDRLVCRLEDIAEGRPDPLPCPGPGQMGLDFNPVPGPVQLGVSTGVHPGVFR